MNELRHEVSGKWMGLLPCLGIDEQYLRKKHGPCPVCGGKDRYRMIDKDGRGEFFCSHCGPGDGFDLLMRVHGWDFKTAANEVRRFMGIVEKEPEQKKRDPSVLLKRIAREASRVSRADAVAAYLAGRGLKATPPELFYHSGLAYFEEGRAVGKYPAMLAVIRDKAGESLTYHVTYLDGGKKASVASPKKVMPPVRPISGGAIRLFGIAEHIGVAEGIETAIAAHEAYGYPVWATVSAGGMESFEVPEGVKHITIFGDNDESYTGQKAAYTLAQRLTVKDLITADVIINPTRGYDFLDDWRSGGGP